MTDAAYESDVFERSQEIQDLYPGTSYEDALQAARRELEARR
jgi:hypothetical protein